MSDVASKLDRIHSVGGCMVRVAYAAFVTLFLLACAYAAIGDPPVLWMVVIAAVAGVAAVMGRRLLLPWAVAAGALSVLSTLFLGLTDYPEEGAPSVFAEIGALLIVMTRTVWRTRRQPLIPTAVLLGAAVLAVPMRWSVLAAALITAPLGIAVAIALGVGLYLRALDARRARSLAAARRDERLELARDLHDFVAHHVTGIVVQAQAARFAAGAGAGPTQEQLDRMFGGIEKAGTEALTSMRRMVGLLRDAQHVNAADGDALQDGGSTRPLGDLAQLKDLVEGFTHPPAALTLAPGLGTLPPEVAASAHRVVQEALTNIRKHAADAASVRVSVARVGRDVEVAVRNDGRGRERRLPSGGFGLTGLAERIGALGGRLHAGPRPEGGWEVVALLPAGGRLIPIADRIGGWPSAY
ncbi:sensor histidine kinase [Actinomadura madurae]|uniref:sensor histidine kinase n=1 Tax=Actinomadura madurae TaxID=1993 RepID=UPI0020D22428|nr:histidine kinase [Actinomadura madurae]MCQ0015123.1 histidine kinase [Actinomadura madurae]